MDNKYSAIESFFMELGIKPAKAEPWEKYKENPKYDLGPNILDRIPWTLIIVLIICFFVARYEIRKQIK